MSTPNAHWQLLALADVAPTPWRNGGGVTRELLSGPASTDWRWRLSVADVAANGPFSRFERTQRWFAVLDGAGVVLRFAQATHRLDAHSEVLSFEGEWPCDCDLIDGPTLDFNLMTRGLPAQMLRVREASHAVSAEADGLAAVFAIGEHTHLEHRGTRLSLPRHALAWCWVSAHERVTVHSPHALWVFIEGAA